MRHFFDVKDPAEKISLPFDFSRDLGVETIASVVGVVISVWSGAESPPTLAQNGAPAIDAGIVYVGVQAGATENDYDVVCKVDTSGGRRLAIAGILPVRAL